jgi:Icc-related predicted phosphoesterase
MLQVPDGDILVHAGDATLRGTKQELQDFNDWLGVLPHADKVFTGGNHDFLLQEDEPAARRTLSNATHVLIHGAAEVQGIRFFGSAWSPWFHDWAFNYRFDEAEALWSQIPVGTDILVTHGPSFAVLDQVIRAPNPRVGCPVLRDHIQRVKPKYHLAGHIHEQYGQQLVDGVTHMNGCILNHRYEVTNPPIVFDI